MQHDADMEFRHEVRYEATVAEVFAMLSDPSFREQSASAMGALSAEVAIKKRGAGVSIRIERVEPTEGVPGFAKKFAGETTEAVQLEEWDDEHGGTIAINTPGKPTSIRGTLSLRDDDGVTVETMEAEVKVKVPLLGKKLETLMANLVRQGMDKEHAVGVRWLEEQR